MNDQEWKSYYKMLQDYQMCTEALEWGGGSHRAMAPSLFICLKGERWRGVSGDGASGEEVWQGWGLVGRDGVRAGPQGRGRTRVENRGAGPRFGHQYLPPHTFRELPVLLDVYICGRKK